MNAITTIRTGALLLSAVSLLTLNACDTAKTSAPASPAATSPAPASPAATSPGAAATVDGTPINDSRVDLMVKQGAAQGQADSPELRAKIIDNLAMQLLVSKEATKKGLDKATEVADQLELAREAILARAFIQEYLKTNPVTEQALTAE